MAFNRNDFILRIIVIIIAAISPFIYIASIGELPSISSYWKSPLQPMFIIVNACTSYFFFSTRRWEISSVMLLLLTAFSFENNFTLHNIFAILFFLFNAYPIYLNKRIRCLIIPYLLSLVLINYSILYAEISAILILCIFHLISLIMYMRIQLKRNSSTYTA